MSIYDCEKCWEVICVCGHSCKNWSAGRIRRQIDMLKGVLKEREKEKETPTDKKAGQSFSRIKL